MPKTRHLHALMYGDATGTTACYTVAEFFDKYAAESFLTWDDLAPLLHARTGMVVLDVLDRGNTAFVLEPVSL